MPNVEMKVSNDFRNLLKKTAESKKNPADSEADVIRRAVALYKYLHDQVNRYRDQGAKVCIVDSQYKPIQEIELP